MRLSVSRSVVVSFTHIYTYIIYQTPTPYLQRRHRQVARHELQYVRGDARQDQRLARLGLGSGVEGGCFVFLGGMVGWMDEWMVGWVGGWSVALSSSPSSSLYSPRKRKQTSTACHHPHTCGRSSVRRMATSSRMSCESSSRA